MEENTEDFDLELKHEDVEYEVQEILDSHIMNGVQYYLIHWKGYDNPADNSWEPITGLQGCQEMIAEFESKRSAQNAKTKKKSNSSQLPSVDDNGLAQNEIVRIISKRNICPYTEYLIEYGNNAFNKFKWVKEEDIPDFDFLYPRFTKVSRAHINYDYIQKYSLPRIDVDIEIKDKTVEEIITGSYDQSDVIIYRVLFTDKTEAWVPLRYLRKSCPEKLIHFLIDHVTHL